MAMRSPAGFISAFFDPLKNPNAPTSPSATAGDASASVSFTAPANVGGSAITAYYAVSNPDQITGTAATSPVSVTGLTNGTAYTFNVWALNSYGPGTWSSATGSVTPSQLQRGLFAGGGAPVNTINYIDIATTGNATSFGQLVTASRGNAGVGSTTRGVSGGGRNATYLSQLSYVTFATTGNATSFGNLTVARGFFGACNSSTVGVWGGGFASTYSAVLDYVTIATAGNATSFGSLATAVYGEASCSSPTRGLFGAGDGGTWTAQITYITIASAGNSVNFGNLPVTNRDLVACSSATRGLFAGGSTDPGSEPYLSAINYVTIASTGNSTTFGNLTITMTSLAACSSATRGTFAGGGTTGGSSTSVISYVTIASTGNAVSFGNLPTAITQQAGFSSSNGGVQ